MGFVDGLKLKIKRGESPFYRNLRRFLKWALYEASVPVPHLLTPAFRLLYELHFLVIVLFRRAVAVFYTQPLFRSRCASVGKNLKVSGRMPFVDGHVEIHVGDNVIFAGPISIHTGRFLDHPRLILKDGAGIGQSTTITVNKEVLIEEGVIISPNCRIADSDGHAKEAELRAKGEPMTVDEIRPVRICQNAWVGTGSQVMKGVTIGEGAIIGANSVVVSDIPPYSIAMGNPAEVYFRNVARLKGKDAGASAKRPADQTAETSSGT